MKEAPRVLAVIEAATVTGPAKNLIRFAKLARERVPGEPTVTVSIATFCRRASNPFINPFIEAARAASIEVHVVPERFAFDPQVVAHLRRLAEELAPDILQTHGVKSHFLARLARLDRHYPWIAFHHGYTAEDLKMRAYNQLDRWSLRSARRVVTVCWPFAEELERSGVEAARIEVLPNSIEPFVPVPQAETDALRERLGLRDGETILLTVGRLSREKAQIDLLRAAKEIARVQPDLKFRVLIAGDGPERRTLEEFSAGIDGRVTFTGHVQDVRPLFGLADIFVLPSLSEGSPNVLLEALAAGVPIVATAVGGVPETVRDEVSALLCPAADPAGLARQIIRLIEDPQLRARLRDSGRAEAAARSPLAHRRTLSGIYSQVVPGTR